MIVERLQDLIIKVKRLTYHLFTCGVPPKNLYRQLPNQHNSGVLYRGEGDGDKPPPRELKTMIARGSWIVKIGISCKRHTIK